MENDKVPMKDTEDGTGEKRALGLEEEHCPDGHTARTATLPGRPHCPDGYTVRTATLSERPHCPDGYTVRMATLPEWPHCLNGHTAQGNLQIQCNSCQITNAFSTVLEQNILKFVWKLLHVFFYSV